ncbi:MAG: 4Fe-4S binding protein [Thermoplasmata archaeon]|nr:4Fe-4S binding protein [Thermoplasmata archaeon]
MRRQSETEWTHEEIDDLLNEFRPITVPISITIQGKQRILAFDEVEKMLLKAKLISLVDCMCRSKIKGCDAPLDVCITLDEEAEESISKKNARQIEIDEALRALKRGHEAGLVHIAYEIEGKKIGAICSCCSCCCHSLAAITRLGYDRSVIEPAKMIASHNADSCDNCGDCVSRCHFGAWESIDGAVRHNPENCAGCGICASFCPSGAISLEQRN